MNLIMTYLETDFEASKAFSIKPGVSLCSVRYIPDNISFIIADCGIHKTTSGAVFHQVNFKDGTAPQGDYMFTKAIKDCAIKYFEKQQL